MITFLWQGLIYLDVLIDDQDQAIVPPLEGFVMNRITEDNFEKLLYKGKSLLYYVNRYTKLTVLQCSCPWTSTAPCQRWRLCWR